MIQLEEMEYEPIVRQRYKYQEMTDAVLDAPLGKWIKMTPFKDTRQMDGFYHTVSNGKRALQQRLKERGVSLKCKRDRKKLIFYFKKENIKENKNE